MHALHQLVTFLNSLPWSTIGTYLGGSTLVATLLQLVKHKLNIAEAKHLVTFLLGLFSFLAVFANYILQSTAQNPLVLGKNTAYVVSLAVFVHRFAVSPTYNKFLPKLQSFVEAVQTVQAAKQPISTTVNETPASVDQFQV